MADSIIKKYILTRVSGSASAALAAASKVAAAASAAAALVSQNAASTSATNAASSASAASTSATNAASSATNAASSASSASTSATNAAASYDSFDDRYLGAKASNPSVDNDGNTLITGALYFNTTVPEMRVWNGSAWVNMPFTATGALLTANNLSELAASPSAARSNLGLGTLATQNGTSSGTNTGDQDLSGLQPLDAELTALAGLASAANKLPYFTGIGTAALADLVAYGRTLIALADAAALAAQLANQSISNPTVTNYTEAVVAIGNSGTTQTIVLTNGTVQTCTLTGNCTFTMPTATAGKSFILLLKTGAGSFTSTFTGVKWAAGTAPTITAAASKMDIISFVADGANWYGSIMQNYTP